MQLLVSVRSAEEVEPALAGGADIIDAKEPDRGSLGSVDPWVLNEILSRVPQHYSVSVALGDTKTENSVSLALNGLDLLKRPSPTFLKLGFAEVSSPNQIQRLIGAAVAGAESLAGSPGIVAVAYADWERAGTVSKELVTELAGAAGAAGVLLDTHGKDGRGLLHWVSPDELEVWVARSRDAGLLTGLAGGLRSSDLAVVCKAEPDVVGVRGAACSGGRWGRVSARQVGLLRLELGRALTGVGEGRSGAQ